MTTIVPVSIVVRTFNEEGNISRCLMALTSQSALPAEILIVDNCSTDETVSLASEFTSKTAVPIRILVNPVRGYSSGLNMGVDAAASPWVGFISADCFPASNWLATLFSVAREKDASVVVAREVAVGDNIAISVVNRRRHITSGVERITFFDNTNIIYRRDLLRPHLPFRGFSASSGGEDTVMSIKYKKSGLLAYRTNDTYVEHAVYESVADFVRRAHEYGKRLIPLLLAYPTYPRLYCSGFYWSFREIIEGFFSCDASKLNIGWLRLRGVVSGVYQYLVTR